MFFSSRESTVAKNLYDYQKEGVEWIINVLKDSNGAILADEMGLGKTIQAIATIEVFIKKSESSKILLIVPANLIDNWENEFRKWQMNCPFNMFYGKDKLHNLIRFINTSGVLLTTYSTMLKGADKLLGILFDIMIVDEGHFLRNESKTTKIVKNLPSKKRLVLTGTPLQNNLMELWSLFDFIFNGKSNLGSRIYFRSTFVNKIHKANEKGASDSDLTRGNEALKKLKEIVSPFVLRRTKEEINTKFAQNQLTHKSDTKFKEIAPKLDLVCWTYLSPLQISIYTKLLQSKELRELMTSERSPLIELQNLKKLCDHPTRLPLSRVKSLREEFKDDDDLELLFRQAGDPGLSPGELMEGSGKLSFAIRLLNSLKNGGHRTLVFSRSLLVLDIIQRILEKQGHLISRLDGQIVSHDKRNQVIDSFQYGFTPFMLLTTMVGGVGLTLTAADRVVIYDPSWNPASDSQAIGRVHRVGQQRPVVVYRLISCGTVEENIYRRQIFKDTINRGITETSDDPFNRHFTHMELRELFSFNVNGAKQSKTQIQLAGVASKVPELFEACLEDVCGHSDCFGISNHELVFNNEEKSSSDSEVIETTIYEEMIKREDEFNDDFANEMMEASRYEEMVKKEDRDDDSAKDYRDLNERGMDVFNSPFETENMENSICEEMDKRMDQFGDPSKDYGDLTERGVDVFNSPTETEMMENSIYEEVVKREDDDSAKDYGDLTERGVDVYNSPFETERMENSIYEEVVKREDDDSAKDYGERGVDVFNSPFEIEKMENSIYEEMVNRGDQDDVDFDGRGMEVFKSLFESVETEDDEHIVLVSSSNSSGMNGGDSKMSSVILAEDSENDGEIRNLMNSGEYVDAMGKTLDLIDLFPGDDDLMKLALELRYILWPNL